MTISHYLLISFLDLLYILFISLTLCSFFFFRLKAQLRLKLMESGWFDNVNELALDKLSTEENPKFDLIAQSLEEQALSKYYNHNFFLFSFFFFIQSYLIFFISSRSCS